MNTKPVSMESTMQELLDRLEELLTILVSKTTQQNGKETPPHTNKTPYRPNGAV